MAFYECSSIIYNAQKSLSSLLEWSNSLAKLFWKFPGRNDELFVFCVSIGILFYFIIYLR